MWGKGSKKCPKSVTPSPLGTFRTPNVTFCFKTLDPSLKPNWVSLISVMAVIAPAVVENQCNLKIWGYWLGGGLLIGRDGYRSSSQLKIQARAHLHPSSHGLQFSQLFPIRIKNFPFSYPARYSVGRCLWGHFNFLDLWPCVSKNNVCCVVLYEVFLLAIPVVRNQ